jgi:hypothetical protein
MNCIKTYFASVLLLLFCNNITSQSSIGISSSAVFLDFYYPVIPETSIGVEGGLVFQQDNFFNSSKLRFHSELSLVNRRKNEGQRELTQMLIHVGLGYKLRVNKKIYFEPVVGVFSKILLQYDNFYQFGYPVKSKFFTLGAYLKPQMNIEINKKFTFSIFTSFRFDVSPTFVYNQSADFTIRMFTLLTGAQLTYKLN